MPDILIRGMEMPKGCAECKLNSDTICVLINGCIYDESNGSNRRPDCHLVELPEHGDLIDRSELKTNMIDDTFGSAARYVNIMQILNAPTIVPSNKEETE